jgi:hypothetical protein
MSLRNEIEKGRSSSQVSPFVSFGQLQQSHHANLTEVPPFGRASVPTSYLVETPRTARTNEEPTKILRVSQMIPNTPKPLREEPSAAKICFKLPSAENVFNGSQVSSASATLLEGKLLTSKELTSTPVRKNCRSITSHSPRAVTRRVSILDLGQEDEGSAKENRRAQVKTTKELNSEESIASGPHWITCKTIERLMALNNENDSLVHSIGTS